MTLEAYITINFNGRFSDGDAAAAIVLRTSNNDKKYIKIYGFSHVSHQHAQALTASRLADMISKPVDLIITVPYSYLKIMIEKPEIAQAHKNLWETFRTKMQQMTSVRVIYNPEHRFKQASIRATEKGGYKMEQIGAENGKKEE